MQAVDKRTMPYDVVDGGSGESKLLDVYRPAGGEQHAPMGCVLLWHGVGPDERDVMAALARQTAAHGTAVFVPDWRSDAVDAGRSQLLASLRYVRDNASAHGGDPLRIVLAGWSAGAGAAIGLALRPDLTGSWRPAAAIGVAGAYDRPARTTGSAPLDDLAATVASPVPVRLLHGTADTMVDGRSAHELCAALRERRWPVELRELDADHASVVGTWFDPAIGRLRPSDDPRALKAVAEAARVVADAAAPAPEPSLPSESDSATAPPASLAPKRPPGTVQQPPTDPAPPHGRRGPR
ncbi:carboxylesterase family protein [Streptomyces sp. NPDC051907]|uniref:alpha/beta hydrolase n=1 Tax=Streptomyces sp. NPDC051907 TaxID=3155284 RepID=UPI003433925E